MPAGQHVAPGQDLHELVAGTRVEQAHRHDAEVDPLVLERGRQVGQVAVGLLEGDVGLEVLELGDHPADHRVHEEGHAADAHETLRALAEAHHGVGRPARGGQDRAAVRRELRAERGRLQRAAALDEERLADAGLEHGERPADGGLALAKRAAPRR